MDNVPQSDRWKQLGLALEAIQDDGSWSITVRRPGVVKGYIRFRVKTRLEYGQLDPHDAFLGFCETLAGLPQEEGDGYQVWLSSASLPDTESYRARFQELLRQRESTVEVFGLDLVLAVATMRPAAERKRVLPASPKVNIL